jgi:mono/diheme cytochrome c family protein
MIIMADQWPSNAARRLRRLLMVCFALGLTLFSASSAVFAADVTGEQIYRQKCASCHGPRGEGVPDNYAMALAGDKSVRELARLIAKTMPQDDPGTCQGKDAEKVAAYIHETFYSPAAQARNKPPRIELSRLTIRQYRNAAADLVGSFAAPVKLDQGQGLHGEYYKSRRFRRSDRVLDRLDAEVNFDFGEASPEPDKLDASGFSIQWEGSVLARDTGEYEFVVNTEHATRLYLNDLRQPLIDAWVKSGDDTEYRGSIFLLGGRRYPLRLEFSKAKQGVDDSKKQKQPPPAVKASIRLKWKPPHRQDEVIPARYLSPTVTPELFVVSTPFPPDDRSAGYERGTSISKAWEQATTDAAIETAGHVAAHLSQLAGARDGAGDREEKLRRFCQQFAERAFRRPLSDAECGLYLDRQFAEAADPLTAVKRVVLLVLKSPRFLYLSDGQSNDPYDIASRLSFALWDSLPDEDLLRAASERKLDDPSQVRRAAQRLGDDERARAKLRAFIGQWLRLDHITELSKDDEKFPEFDAELASQLRASLEWFVDDCIASGDADFRQLLLADSIYMNGRLAKFYGAELPDDAPMQRVRFEPESRAGVLTHPFLLAGFAYTSTSSPIHRGVFISRSLLGRSLRPPPEAVSPLAPDLHASLTTRERVELQTGHAACQACHQMINPLGFTLENFDAVGRYRDRENAKPINAAGGYVTREGREVTFASVRELAQFLADSDETHTALVEQLFQYMAKQPIRAYGAGVLPSLTKGFADEDFNLKSLLVNIAATAALPAPSLEPQARQPTTNTAAETAP